MNRPLLALVVAALLAAPAVLHAQRPDPPLRQGDRLLVKLWVDSAFADTIRIGPGGMAILPRLGPLRLEGMPLSAVGDSVRRAYGRVLASPVVEVTPLIRVTALGELRAPGVLFVEPGTLVRDLIAQAGGITPEGRWDRVSLLRNGEQRRLADWAAGGSPATMLQSGDVVVVKRESWARRNTLGILSTATVIASLIISTTR